MNYIHLDGVAQDISRFILGTASPPFLAGEPMDALLETAWNQGITTFDTARSYGKSEDVLGTWIEKKGIRTKVNILSKGCNPDQTGIVFTPESLRTELETSLAALKTDYVDMYALHRDDESVPVEVFIETLNAFRREGKIKVLGASNWRWERMQAANEYAARNGLEGFRFGEPAFSLAVVLHDPFGGSVHVSGEECRDARAWFARSRVPIFAYSPVARGFLSGKVTADMSEEEIRVALPAVTFEEYYGPSNLRRLQAAQEMAHEKGTGTAQIVLAWILAQPFIGGVIVGPAHPKHLLEDLEAQDVHLSQDECLRLNLGVPTL